MDKPLVNILTIENTDHEEKPVEELIQVQQAAEAIGFAYLPFEILFLILEPMRPIYEHPGLEDRPYYYIDTRRSSREAIKSFNQDLRKFADLRLLCAQLDTIISQIAYRELVLFIGENTNIEKVAAVFERVAEHIRSVVIVGVGENRYYQPSHHSSWHAEVASVIGYGLHRCTKIQNLSCYHNHHTFTSRDWLPTMTPALSSTLTSLVLSPTGSQFDLSHALVGLGRTVRTLEIINWNELRYHTTFHASGEMPNLSKLILRGGRPSLDRVRKLFNRIRGKGAGKSSPLRSLAFIGVDLRSGQEVLRLLSINHIGAQLTSLRLHFNGRTMSFILPIIKACPSLLEFACTSEAGKDIFVHLPPMLERLELSVARDSEPIPLTNQMELAIPLTFHDLTSYMGSGSAGSIRSLSVHTKRCSPYSVDILPLNSLCTNLGIEIRWHISSIGIGW